MTTATATKGRRVGSINRGYFFRNGRGWTVTDGANKVLLRDASGKPLSDRTVAKKEIAAAVKRYHDQKAKQVVGANGITVRQLAAEYLAHSDRTKSANTYRIHRSMLFDFLTGYSVAHADKEERPKNGRIHAGYADRLAESITFLDVDHWLAKHKWTNRLAICSVKAMYAYGKERGLISVHPLKGFRVPTAGSRLTYLNDNQQAAMMKLSKPEFAWLLKILLRTGARPSEFRKLTARDVTFHDGYMLWTIDAKRVKTRKERRIYCTDKEIIEYTRQQVALHPDGELFRDERGLAWRFLQIGRRFRLVRRKCEALGITFSKDDCLYSCRHTFAKETLSGKYTGKPQSIPTLAALMGNSPQEAMKYATWASQHVDPLLNALRPA